MNDLLQLVRLQGLGYIDALRSREVRSKSRAGGNRWWMQVDGLCNS